MMTPDAFVIALYVLVDDFCKAHYTPPTRTGSAASLCASEVLTLALFGQWGWFPSERAFYRYARNHFLALFPRLPHRAQFNRLVRDHTTVAVALFRHLVELLGAHASPFQALDSAGIATRNLKRRGEGWLPGLADIGWSNRRGWYEGFHLLQSITPEGVITGFGFSSASVNDHPLAETFFMLRRTQPSGYAAAAGLPADGPYLADSGFAGRTNFTHWKHAYGATVIAPPQRSQPRRGWTAELRRWIASRRQIVETVFSRLFHTFGLDRERPHNLQGLQARLAAKAALHNFCILLNRQLGRVSLAFADLVDW